MHNRPLFPSTTVNHFAVALAAAVGLTVIFWWPMWLGDGVIGGDIMDYFYPQKVYLAEALKRGDIPLWNNLVALGYPFVADSQIALWYPTTIPLYSMLSVESAFQTNVLIHYVLAFLFTWGYGRAIGLRQAGALMASLAFTYGWFPPRLSVEWAITTGCYLPAAMLCVEGVIRTGRRRWLALLATVLALQILAGHFSLTFITHVMIGCYVVARITFAKRRTDRVSGPKAIAGILAIQVVAFPLAAAQLAPTWELREQSQRGGLPIPGVDHGRIPWPHLAQVVMPWIAYGNDMSEYPPPYTNGPAASLFVGVLPFLLACSTIGPRAWRHTAGRVWICVIPIAVVFAVGWLTPIYQHLPGFGYFKVPGRYSLLAAFGLAVLAGIASDRLVALSRKRFRRLGRPSLVAGLGGMLLTAVTIVDLYVYGRTVAFTSFVPLTIDELLAQSAFRDLAESSPTPLRMLVPGNNALTCTGISAVPGFLGLSPEAYGRDGENLPSSIDPIGPKQGQLDQLRRLGVTHVIFEEPFDAETWEIDARVSQIDVFLSAVMNRRDPATGKVRPWELGRLAGSRGRATIANGDGQQLPQSQTRFETYEPDEVTVVCRSPAPATLILTDLMFPGWTVSVDGQPATPQLVEGMFRGVQIPAGEHRVVWSYHPRSIDVGFTISAITLVLLVLTLWKVRLLPKVAVTSS